MDPIRFQLGILATRFPTGATETVMETDRVELARLGLGDHLPEAVLRILHTWERRTYPPLAVTLRRCRDVQSEARAGTRAADAGSHRRFTPDDLQHFRVLRLLARLDLYWCDRAWSYTRGVCPHGSGCASGSTLHNAQARLSQAEIDGEEPPPREKPWGNLRESLGGVT